MRLVDAAGYRLAAVIGGDRRIVPVADRAVGDGAVGPGRELDVSACGDTAERGSVVREDDRSAEGRELEGLAPARLVAYARVVRRSPRRSTRSRASLRRCRRSRADRPARRNRSASGRGRRKQRWPYRWFGFELLASGTAAGQAVVDRCLDFARCGVEDRAGPGGACGRCTPTGWFPDCNRTPGRSRRRRETCRSVVDVMDAAPSG